MLDALLRTSIRASSSSHSRRSSLLCDKESPSPNELVLESPLEEALQELGAVEVLRKKLSSSIAEGDTKPLLLLEEVLFDILSFPPGPALFVFPCLFSGVNLSNISGRFSAFRMIVSECRFDVLAAPEPDTKPLAALPRCPDFVVPEGPASFRLYAAPAKFTGLSRGPALVCGLRLLFPPCAGAKAEEATGDRDLPVLFGRPVDVASD